MSKKKVSRRNPAKRKTFAKALRITAKHPVVRGAWGGTAVGMALGAGIPRLLGKSRMASSLGILAGGNLGGLAGGLVGARRMVKKRAAARRAKRR